MISSFRLSELASILNGQLHGQDVIIHGVSIDTRTLTPVIFSLLLLAPV